MFDTLANLGCDDQFYILGLNSVSFLVGAVSCFIDTCAHERFNKFECGLCNPEVQLHLFMPTIPGNMYYLVNKHNKT
jgi:hypothetical protein